MREKCDYLYCDEQAMVGYKTCNTHYRIYTLEQQLATETARADKAEARNDYVAANLTIEMAYALKICPCAAADDFDAVIDAAMEK